MEEIVDHWFTLSEEYGGVAGYTEPHVHPLLRANIWHIPGRDRDLVVDSGCGIAPLADRLPRLFAHTPALVLTHSHLDHMGGAHEFAERWAHAAEAAQLRAPETWISLRGADFPEDFRTAMAELGAPLGESLLTALPWEGYDPGAHHLRAAPPTRALADGEVLDLGDRRFEVLHLPGHSPGSIGLYERDTGILCSGDVVYEGPLLDDAPGSDREAYRATMERLLRLPVTRVLCGHGPSLGPERLREICRAYLGS
ncbi:MBL fold metallo-hydrolase [Streptomyces boncukensis]|uniref:MBL fold metallo-hydrolase n=1 Tax=Streptomyces boncukensis TaxID=2711219 RepID=A0A6G4WUG7_9ACTN|nr:MBL fold metallo-hydrolase [Streptomyces boncukensis]NGO68492.1 MBL fold metallo-hydrolase [Streptomyces boncukensis]